MVGESRPQQFGLLLCSLHSPQEMEGSVKLTNISVGNLCVNVESGEEREEGVFFYDN